MDFVSPQSPCTTRIAPNIGRWDPFICGPLLTDNLLGAIQRATGKSSQQDPNQSRFCRRSWSRCCACKVDPIRCHCSLAPSQATWRSHACSSQRMRRRPRMSVLYHCRRGQHRSCLQLLFRPPHTQLLRPRWRRHQQSQSRGSPMWVPRNLRPRSSRSGRQRRIPKSSNCVERA